MTKATDYIWIERWGKFLGSFDYYIKREQAKALNENASLSATYKREDGSWATINNVTNSQTKEYFEHWYADCSTEGFWND